MLIGSLSLLLTSLVSANEPLPPATATIPATRSALDTSAAPGANFDLGRWKITFADASEAETAWLVSGATRAGEFYTDPDSGGMVFVTPNLAAATSGSRYARTELREMLRGGRSHIPAKGVNGNNWVLSSAPRKARRAAGGVDGALIATVSVDHVSTTGDRRKVGRVVVGQIHGAENELCRLYYRKLPGNSLGAVYFAHEPLKGGLEQWVELIGSRSDSAQDPVDGIGLGEPWGYVIKAVGNELTVTIQRANKPDVSRTLDMRDSGFQGDWLYFKAGVYNQNNTGERDDFAQATFYRLIQQHSQ